MNKKYTKKQIQEAIKYWEDKLSMLDESVDGMVLANIRKNLKELASHKPATDAAVTDGAMELLDVEEIEVQNPDGRMRNALSLQTKEGEWRGDNRPYHYGDVVQASFVPKHNATYANGRQFHNYEWIAAVGQNASFEDLHKALSFCGEKMPNVDAQVKTEIMNVLRGHAISLKTFSRLVGWHINNQMIKNKKRETTWTANVNRDLENDKKYGPFTIPEDWTTEAIADIADSLYGGSCYEHFVPDEYEEVEGAQTDVDDWDMYRINIQDTISEDDFYEQLADNICYEFDPGEVVKGSVMVNAIEDAANSIAQDAYDKYDPTNGYQTRKGSHGHSYYY